MLSFLKSKLGLGLLVILCIVLSSCDPFSLDSGGVYSNSIIKVVYFLPFFAWWIYLLLIPEGYGRKSAGEIKAEWIEKAKSLLRSGMQLVGLLISLNEALNLNIKFLAPISATIDYLALNIDVAAAAIGTVIGTALTIYGFFVNNERFEDRVGNPHQANKLS